MAVRIFGLASMVGALVGCNAILGIEDHGLSPPSDKREAGPDAPNEDSSMTGDVEQDGLPVDADLDASVPSDISDGVPSDGRISVDMSIEVGPNDAPMADVLTDASGTTDTSGTADTNGTLDAGGSSDASVTDDVDAPASADAAAEAESGANCSHCPTPTNGSAVCEAGICGIICNPNWTACGGECVDVGGDARHCGRCSHGCGGGLCSQGVCQPTAILSGMNAPGGLAVDANGVYFTLDNRVLSCPLDGCVQAPRQLGSNLSSAAAIVVANGTVVFRGALTFDACPTAGCPATIPSVGGWSAGGKPPSSPILFFAAGSDIYYGISAGYNNYTRCVAPAPTCTENVALAAGSLTPPAAVGDGKFFIVDASDQDGGRSLVSYSVTQPSGSKATVVSDWAPWLPLLAAAGGNIYFPIRPLQLQIAVCPQAGCTSRATFALLPEGIKELIADATGVHWIQGSDEAASIATCPLAGCTNGPQIVATHQPLASYLQSDGQYLYWVNRGNPGDGGSGPEPRTAAIMRVAR